MQPSRSEDGSFRTAATHHDIYLATNDNILYKERNRVLRATATVPAVDPASGKVCQQQHTEPNCHDDSGDFSFCVFCLVNFGLLSAAFFVLCLELPRALKSFCAACG